MKGGHKQGYGRKSLDLTASLEQLTIANGCMVSCGWQMCTFVRLRDSESKDVCIHK